MRISDRKVWLLQQLAWSLLLAAAVMLGVYVGRSKNRVQHPEPSSTQSAASNPPPRRDTDEEMEQRLKWHWAAINKCKAKGLHAVMGFNDEVICLDPGAWAWVYDGKGPP